MSTSDMEQSYSDVQKNFWDSLQSEILISNQKLSPKDILSLIEQSFMFSMFFRACSQTELIDYQTLLSIKENAYIIMAELTPLSKSSIADFNIDEMSLHQKLKEVLHNVNHSIGPLITNRICILISSAKRLPDQEIKEEGIAISNSILKVLSSEYKLTASFGIGTVHNINSVYTSFIEALSGLHYCSIGEIICYMDLKEDNEDRIYDYAEAEKHLFDSIRLRKNEAYDYFSLMMDWIRPLNDEAKRNKILETLVLSSYAMRIDNPSLISFNYSSHLKELMEISQDKLLEWAFQSFVCITGYVKPQNSIDYSNKIVQATKEYLETHYAEDISLDDIAEQVNISPQYFSKLIKKTTGYNFIDWLSILRVKKAKELLTNSNFTVKEVCFMVGYRDPNYFSRIFKKRIGITPSEYIKSNIFSSNN